MKVLKEYWMLILGGIVAILYFFREIIIDLLISSARNVSNEARDQDEKLAAEQKKDEARAEFSKNAAEMKEKEIKKIEGDEEWHKKK